ncbi:hypothetical protein F2Q70_00001323 [Brassica cretica]|uniref:Uncharacterized protein n=1 Tax=Brassica cretica TaxID=69181 RepID=A0A8S9ITF7_BRACR|nr:hypothetical protein F2Q70_00001323 [Brassica cretica]
MRPLPHSRQHQTARVRRSRHSRSSNKGRPRPDRSDSIHSSSRPVRVQLAAQLLWWFDSTIIKG